jgi:predicted unusual protein kinase regulating ubiquinone biosynthesis (AarF/ABC1/UbiB family)
VHRATTKDGQHVAVKVQHPRVVRQLDGDLWTIAFMLRIVKLAFDGFDFLWTLPEFKNGLAEELDFAREADNSDRCRKGFKDLCVAPLI